MNNEMSETESTHVDEFEIRLTKSLEKINSGIALLNEIKDRYERLLDVHSDAIQPLEVATETLNEMVSAFNSLKNDHQKTLAKLQEGFVATTQKSCNELDSHVEHLLEKVNEFKGAFDSLQGVRETLLSDANSIADSLADNGKALLKPFEELNVKFEALYSRTLAEFQQQAEVSEKHFADFNVKVSAEFDKCFTSIGDFSKQMSSFVEESKTAFQEQVSSQEKMMSKMEELFDIWKKDCEEKEKTMRSFIKFQKVSFWIFMILLIASIAYLKFV